MAGRPNAAARYYLSRSNERTEGRIQMKNGMIGSGFRMGVATLIAVGLLASMGCSTSDGAIEAATSPATVDAGPAANPAGTGETKTVAIDNTTGATIALSDGAAITVP